ncbi:MAG: SDR family NAD(P)-dependent oxidoreductase, partial [Planctomycetes bacterium]|nr:SDR family NAD(P)-dependent oxidoreductase [Planctomycetota bacterium]
GDMFELGAKVQVVKKNTEFPKRANKLYQLFTQYASLEAIPASNRKDLETEYFKRSLEEVWKEISEYKQKKNPEQLQEAEENERLRLRLIFQWYFAHSTSVTLEGRLEEKDNFQIHCGPALGSFNQWVQGTRYEHWKNRHVDGITEILFTQACSLLQKQPGLKQEREAIKAHGSQDKNQDPVSVSFPETNRHQYPGNHSIAIIGRSGQFPQSRNIKEFWENLARGRDCITEIPEDRWSIKEYYHAEETKEGQTNCKWMGILKNADKFDPLFFNISPAEAEWMDPQQRLFLESAWSCIEDAGINPQTLSSSQCGVFVGCGAGDYGQTIQGDRFSSKHLMGASSSILSARISYLLNLKGPCLSIDTACSSSLVAIAEACGSLMNRTSNLALAGGVCVLSGPSMHIMTSQSGMLSKDGRCFTFDARANGFVPGEGVGVILLKRLEDAVRDKDPIHGIIRGWGVNHDGKTNGITAPSVNSQIRLEKDVYERFGIDPASISLVEAHGTGTKLGDPIEVEALLESFESQRSKKHSCALGSVKANIGHLLAAAGVSGVIKVLLCLQHQKLVPHANFKTLNPQIALKNSRFYVNTKLQDWRTADGIPRRACVSSFGFSGTNAHLVIEEAPPTQSQIRPIVSPSVNREPLFIPLSAKSRERLQAHVEQLRLFLLEQNGTEKEPKQRIEDIAYTLQVGRAVLEERVIFIVKDESDLLEKLKSFLANEESIKACYRGSIKKNEENLEDLLVDVDMEKTIDSWIVKKKYLKLLKLWVKGLVFDWNKLYGDNKPKRISLPTYPFARDRYWISETQGKGIIATAGASVSVIHPLLHENTSDLTEQRFTSTFTGDEFFLADHQVKGEKVFPGVGYLEMARAAVEKSTGETEEGAVICLKNVVWAKPIVVNGAIQKVHIGLFGEESGQIHYEVYTETGCEEGAIVHSQGVVEFKEKEETANLDVHKLRIQMNERLLSAEDCYQAFTMMGIDYGEGHRGIREIYKGENQVLARLCLPASVQDTQNEYVLHPSLMDSVLQSSIGLMLNNGVIEEGNGAQLKPALPFALEVIEILTPCTAVMYAWVRYSEGSALSDKVRKLDIDVCDEQGTVCVKMGGFSTRILESEFAVSKTENSIATLLSIPAWKEQNVSLDVNRPEYSEHQILLCEMSGIGDRELQSLVSGSYCNRLEAKQEQIESRFCDYTTNCFEMVKGVLGQEPSGKVLVQVVVPITPEQSLFAGISGLLKTAALENPKLVGQIIQVDPLETRDGLTRKLEENKNAPNDAIIKYEGGKRVVLTWEELTGTDEKPDTTFKDQGVYLITGGLGGLGGLFTREILKQAKDAKIVLTGRSELSAQRQSVIDELQALGGEVEYQKVDVSKPEQVNSLIESIQSKYGKLDGIIHGAGVISDNFILKKTSEEFRNVLLPKVNGTVNLDKATQDIDLDFFVLFSSGAGAMGNPGQADYATANAFMDRFAAYRNRLADSKERKGQTLSINWPLWKDGGMGVDTASEEMMKQSTGMIAMQTEIGVRALYQCLNSRHSQIVVMEGLVSKMRKTLFSDYALKTKIPISQAATTLDSIDAGSLTDKIRKMLKQTVSKTLKIDIGDIDIDVEFNEYGFDSITLTGFANQLNNKYNLELTPTVLFEHSTIGSFADYLGHEHCAVFIEHFRMGTGAQTATEGVVGKVEPALTLEERRTRFVTTRRVAGNVQEVDPAVIVGMSGCFPEAENVDQFWQNLMEEKDCIREIPKERWDWKALYGDPHKEVNKCNIKWGGFIKSVFEFDPLFFGISPREAELMDPQQRLLMTYVYLALEDAGYSVSALSGSNTGIFVGTANSGYSGVIERAGTAIEGYTPTGTVPSLGPNRMSYFLNFHGPSEPIETACSSSLVAIHRALQAMEGGSCDAAIVGGINTIVTPEAHISFNKAGMLCDDGRCKTFSSRANGYVRGEGVGMLFLKKLSQAEADGDHIYGLIRGSAENHGGRANSLTAPNPKAQAELLKTAYKKSGLDPKTITYIEAHGTGTELGDPIEIKGLKTAFKELYQEFGYDPAKTAHCGIGSVKSNIGHLELAAGVAGVIKVLQQFKHKKLVRTLHCSEVNPYIDLNKTPFYLVKESCGWDRLKDDAGREIPRRVGVSSFGFGGTNAHVVLEEYSPPVSETVSSILIQTKNPVIIPLSARTKAQLEQRVKDLYGFLRSTMPITLKELNEDGEGPLAARVQLQGRMEKTLAEILKVDKDTLEPGQSFRDYGVERIHLTRLFELITREHDFELDVDEWIKQDSIESLLHYCVGEGKEFPGQSEAENHAVDLQSLAYTLQVGREGMEERLGFIVTSIKELEEKLDSYLSGDEEIEDRYKGQVKRNKDTLALFNADEELREIIEKRIARKKYPKLLDLWVKGLVLDWNKLYGEIKPKRISLPTYPFARERYWIAEVQGKGIISNAGAAVSVIHPLLHENTSDLSEQRFTSTFTGKEFFLSDHQVNGEKVLPGVCYLEMARAAVEKASGEKEAGTAVHLKNIVWAQPIVANCSDQKLHIGLYGEDDGQIQYEVYTESDNEEGAIVHSQGIAEFKEQEETPPLDIQNLQSQMNQGTLSAEDCYEAFKEMGIDYGEGYRGIREIYQGENQLLARLSLPSSVQDTKDEYLLHPSLMDAALQSSIGLMLSNSVLPDGIQSASSGSETP